MKLGNKKEEKKQTDEKKDNEIKIIMGDDSDLEISDVGDCMNDLRPKKHEKQKKGIVIPKTKK